MGDYITILAWVGIPIIVETVAAQSTISYWKKAILVVYETFEYVILTILVTFMFWIKR